jgi:hypothetical protein
MAKIIEGSALIVAGVVLEFVPGGAAFSPYLFEAGAGMVIGGLVQLLMHSPGTSVASRNPIAPWQMVYGRQRIGGTIVDIAESGDSNKYLHLIVVHASHQVQSIDALYLNGQQVFVDGSGNALNNQYYDLSGNRYSFYHDGSPVVHWETFTGSPTQAASSFYIANGPASHWDSTCKLSGHAYSYIRLKWNVKSFPNGLPSIKVDITGKNDIYDPRTNTSGYTTNAALVINDYLCADFGVRATNSVVQNQITNGGFESNTVGTPTVNNGSDYGTKAIAGQNAAVGDGWKLAVQGNPGTTSIIQTFFEHYSATTTSTGLGNILLRIPANAVVPAGYVDPTRIFSSQIPVLPGSVLAYSCDMGFFASASVPVGITVLHRLGCWFYDVNGNFTGEDYIDRTFVNGTGAPDVYSRQTRSSAVPIGSAYAIIQCAGFLENTTGASITLPNGLIGDMRFDNVSVDSVSPAYISTATSEIDETQLIAAANLCDESVATTYDIDASGNHVTTTPRYALNGTFTLAQTPGDVLNNMLTSCGGQITYVGGQFKIFPSSWRSPSVSLDQTYLIGPVQAKFTRKKRELINIVRGTFVSPAAWNITFGPGFNPRHHPGATDVFNGQWQVTDIAAYAQDNLHGYASSDVNYVRDGNEHLYANMKWPYTISHSTAQRLAKIMLLRNRRQVTATLTCDLRAYNIQALDIIQFSYPRYGWVNKTFEVTATRLTYKSDGGKPPVPVYEIEIAETDASVYTWNTSEENNLFGSGQPWLPNNVSIEDPTNLVLESGSTDVVTGADGIKRSRIHATWTAPLDHYVIEGGHIQIQLQKAGDTTWTQVGVVNGDVTSFYIGDVTDGQSYNVQIRSVNKSGVPGNWVEVGPEVCSSTYSFVTSQGINPGAPTNQDNNAIITSIDAGGSATIEIYGPGGVGSSFTRYFGQYTETMPAGTITGQAYTTAYIIVYDVVSLIYRAITSNKNALSDNYKFIGLVTTLAAGGVAPPPGGGGGTGGGGSRGGCTECGTLLQTNFGILPNDEIYRLWKEGADVRLVGRSGNLESIRDLEWVPVTELYEVEVEGFAPFRCSTSHAVLPYGAHQYEPIENVQEGSLILTSKGWRRLQRKLVSVISCVLRVSLEGPYHEYWIGDGIWTHNKFLPP